MTRFCQTCREIYRKLLRLNFNDEHGNAYPRRRYEEKLTGVSLAPVECVQPLLHEIARASV